MESLDFNIHVICQYSVFSGAYNLTPPIHSASATHSCGHSGQHPLHNMIPSTSFIYPITSLLPHMTNGHLKLSTSKNQTPLFPAHLPTCCLSILATSNPILLAIQTINFDFSHVSHLVCQEILLDLPSKYFQSQTTSHQLTMATLI